MTNTMTVNTVWDGPMEVDPHEITEAMIHGFRKGGCAALALALYKMIPGSLPVVFCDEEPLDDEHAADAWGHAGVMLPTGEILDIGGLDDYWSEAFCYTYVPRDPDEFIVEAVYECPPQEETAVIVTATNLARKLSIRHEQIVSLMA
jgi:hypothetical protein